MESKSFQDILLIKNDQIRACTLAQSVLNEIHRSRGIHCDHIVELLDLLPGHHPKEMRRKKSDFKHVVPAKRIISIGNIVLTEADQDILGQ